MGYASVAGLPLVYGLYGSLLPILLFALISSSPRLVFGVDAAPAALCGGIIASLGLQSESPEALKVIPVITILVAFWLIIFFFIKADRVLKFISQPVMGGFISGIGTTIILMQIPKLFGGTSVHGEVIELVAGIAVQAAQKFNLPSLLLGIGTIAIILVCKKFCPKIPVQAILMFAGAAFTLIAGQKLKKWGIQTLPSVEQGLPKFILPDLRILHGQFFKLLIPSLSIAVVILSETLLATTNFARKHGETINPRREILAYAAGNLSASFCGCCPINGSVSRTGIASQLGVNSQVMSISAFFVMGAILLFGTGFIQYLPVPVLTGIVISALIGTLEFSFANKLFKVDRAEFFIFYTAFFAVLFLGTIYGVITGVLLATVTFIIRLSKPTTDFLGIVPDLKGYYSLSQRNSQAKPLKGVILYRFSAPLFYANISQFCDDITKEILKRKNIHTVIVDSSAISSVDASSTERLLELYNKLAEQNIKLYLAGHVSSVNDQLREFGGSMLIEKRAVRARILYALADAGIEAPFTQEMTEFENPAEDGIPAQNKIYTPRLAEFDWAFGKASQKKMTEIAERLAEEISVLSQNQQEIDIKFIREKERLYSFGYWDEADEDEFLDILELQLELLHEQGIFQSNKALDEKIMQRHIQLEELLMQKKSEIIHQIVKNRWHRDIKFKQLHPKAAAHIEIQYERYFEELAMHNPELAKELADIIASEEENEPKQS